MSEMLEIAVGSGNVFADMGLEDAEELMIRAQLGHAVRKILEEKKKRRQRNVSELLGIDRAEVSKLMGGKYHLFSEGRLLGFLRPLCAKVRAGDFEANTWGSRLFQAADPMSGHRRPTRPDPGPIPPPPPRLPILQSVYLFEFRSRYLPFPPIIC